MILDGKSVRLILYPGYQLKAFTVRIYGQFHVIVIQSSGPVVVVLYHTADRDIEFQFLKYLERYIYLSFSSVHQKYVRIFGKAAESRIFAFFGHFAPRVSSRRYLM